MAQASYGTGTIFKRGNIWYVSYWVDGKQVQKSSGSTNMQDAKKLRDQILGKKARGKIVVSQAAKVTCGELLDDFLPTMMPATPNRPPRASSAGVSTPI